MFAISSRGFAAAMILVATCMVASADSIGTVYVSLGPNANTPSPSYDSGAANYTMNAQTDVRTGAVTPGYPSSPFDYHSVTTITTADMMVDANFANWRGIASPLPLFDNETGTMVFFSVDIKGTFGQNDISLSEVSTATSDTDPYNNAPCGYFCDSFTYSNSAYADDAVGYFADGSHTHSGESSTDMVNEIVLTGYGLAYDAALYAGSGQDQLDDAINAANQNPGPMTLQVCYTLSPTGGNPVSSCGSVNVVSTIPEPSTFGFLCLVASLAVFTRRIRRI